MILFETQGTSASFANLDSLQGGSHGVSNQKVVLVYDLQNLQAPGLHIQDVLGEDFSSNLTC